MISSRGLAKGVREVHPEASSWTEFRDRFVIDFFVQVLDPETSYVRYSSNVLQGNSCEKACCSRRRCTGGHVRHIHHNLSSKER